MIGLALIALLLNATRKIPLYCLRPVVDKFHTSRRSVTPIEENQTVIPSETSHVKKTRIAYIKVHKTASTTIAALIQRYGLNHRLTFALPLPKSLYHIGFYQTFDPVNVRPLPKGKVYEALCQHVVYNRTAFRKYMPKDMRIIASVREPFDRSVSAFNYFKAYSKSVISKANISGNAVTLIREFFKKPNYYEPSIYTRGSLVMNRMAFDLGIPRAQYFNATYVDEYIRQLDEDMAFVLIAEYIDQSLVLLKRIMGWSTEDILYTIRHKGKTKPQFPNDLRIAHKKLAPAEYQIYDYFLTKFNISYSKEVEIEQEVRVFKDTLHRVHTFCSSKKQVLMVPPTKFDKGFNFTRTDCYFINLEETAFVAFLSKLQRP
ncbi:galactose-3-O-sulfotransferase 3-like [Liolophura sinensis]|uniref:galactose-3-O-sulfotransferase 3-like n=1 Tax=Liolophura sinensis TaxID=3198878 RepID=UPI003158BCCA